jgi:NADH dehydrogenase
VTKWYDIPGAQKLLHPLKTKDDAQDIYAEVSTVLETKSAYNFVVCGGGLTGVEFASTLADHILEATQSATLDDTDFSVTLIHSRDKVLHTLPEQVSAYSTDFLAKQGIQLCMKSRVQKVTAKFIHTSTGKIPFDSGIWCG